MEVRLFATLRNGRGKEADIPWAEGINGHSILAELSIEPEEVKIFLINGVHSSPDAELKDDDIIALFPAVGGG